jgi:hypothetical protein
VAVALAPRLAAARVRLAAGLAAEEVFELEVERFGAGMVRSGLLIGLDAGASVSELDK